MGKTESILIVNASEKDRTLRKEILKIWIVLLIGFGNLILIIGTHLLENWINTSHNIGFTFFSVEITNNLIIDVLYALIFILQSILMYLILENRIKQLLAHSHDKKK